MSEDLQGLLNKINSDGIQKAETEKAAIIAAAKTEAEKIIAAAKTKAEGIVKDAETNAVASEAKAKAAIQQAARDILIALRTNLQGRLSAVAKECAGSAMTPDLMGKIILEMVKSYREKHVSGEIGVEVLLAKKDLDDMEKLLKGGLLAGLQAKGDISLGHDFAAGMKVAFKGNDVFLDFSDEALADILCAFVGPKLAAVIKG